MPLDWTLNPNEARVLGALIEKQVTTPEYYPLSINALVNACNQKSNREPVMQLDEDQVRLALRNLQDKRLAASVHEGRVPKYQHQFQEVLNLTRGQTALICVLLLRGPQTPGELRGRSERLHAFAELDEVQAVLQQLMQHGPPLAALLPRQPGTKEARYAHLLSGPVAAADFSTPAAEPRESHESLLERVERLEAAVAALQARLPPPSHRTLIETAYTAFNDRDIETVLALMHPDVDWPNGMEGGRVHGRAEVREYWLRQWGMINPHVDPVAIDERSADEAAVTVHQVVRDMQGAILSDEHLLHTYSIRGGLIARMDILEFK